jgi:hypothetical protein
MMRLCRDSSCSYLGRSVPRAVLRNSAAFRNESGDETEVSSGHSTYIGAGSADGGRTKHQPRRSHAYLNPGAVCAEREVRRWR